MKSVSDMPKKNKRKRLTRTRLMVYDMGEVINMRGRDILGAIMEKKNVSNAQMAHRLEVSIATMWDRVNSKKTKDIPVSMLNDMVRVLDYKIVVVPSNKKVGADEYEITSEPTAKNIEKDSEKQ